MLKELLLLALLIQNIKSNNDDENCVWSYRCCEFKKINNVTRCERMCEAVINCETTTTTSESVNSNEVESFNQTTDEQSQAFLYSLRRQMPVPMCRSGFKYVNGVCRRVYKKANIVTTTAVEN